MNILKNDGAPTQGDKSPPMHQGKWTTEEEEYVECLIDSFKAGVVPVPEGTTLRVFLSKMLNCPRKRISKKFVGTNYNGKQVYVRKGEDEVTSDTVNEYHKKLRVLEQKFLKSLSPMVDFHAISAKKNVVNEEAKEQDQATGRLNGQRAATLHVSNQIPQQKISATASGNTGGGTSRDNNGLSDALQQASYRQLIEARALREQFLQDRLRSNIAAQQALLQNTSLLQQAQFNTGGAGPSNELLWSVLNQKMPLPASSTTTTGLGSTFCSANATPVQQYLMDVLKRKMPDGAPTQDTPVSKRARQA